VAEEAELARHSSRVWMYVQTT